jgi:enoyl-CoA hydratase/carnithine racemase
VSPPLIEDDNDLPQFADEWLREIAEDNPKAGLAQLAKLFRQEGLRQFANYLRQEEAEAQRYLDHSDLWEARAGRMIDGWFWSKYASVLKKTRGGWRPRN